MAILNDVSKMTREDLLALVAQMQAQPARTITLKVGKSGTVCLYHGARYPVTLYRSQWERVLPFLKSGAIERFIEANAALLASDKA